jgi:hypothetical protein
MNANIFSDDNKSLDSFKVSYLDNVVDIFFQNRNTNEVDFY